MSRPLDTGNTAAIAATVTAPRWLVRMDFDTPMRLTNGESVIWPAQGGMFMQADIDVAYGEVPRVTVFNESRAIGATVLNQGTAGRAIVIWQAYRTDGATSSLSDHAEPVKLFEGQMASATIAESVAIHCRRTAPLYTPRVYVRPPTFNHLPRRGSVIVMPNHKITLE